jgi:parallel beta-helix repeat protein
MKNRIISIIIVCFLTTAGFLGFITFESNVVSATNTWYVGSGPGNDSATIQGGINLASDGDTVFVYSGTYTENVEVYKIINLTGEDRDITIIDGGGGFSDVVKIDANWINITGFTIINGSDGIHLYNNNNISIINNIVSDNRYGITLWYSMNNILVNNTMLENGIFIQGEDPNVWNTHSIDTSNTVNGKPVFYWKNQNGGTIPPGAGQVILANCTNVKIENQNVSNGSVGIQLGFSNNNYIAKNSASLNNMYGIHLYFTEYNILTNNIANWNGGNGIYYYRSSNNTLSGNNISNNGNNGIAIVGGNYNTATSNDVFSNLRYGIGIRGFNGSSSRNIIGNNNALYNEQVGISLSQGVTLSNIINNNASNNVFNGIRLFQGSNNNVINNNASNNMFGIYIKDSSNNNVYHNNIINNTMQAFDDTNNGNQWDNSYSIPFNPATDGGNYWSDFDEPSEGAYDDYQGQNQDIMGSDGIVDMGGIGGKNPYVIDSDSQDNYPLINPYDTSPPIITNLQPPDGSTTNDNTPTISANYSDPSGINVSSVVLKVDGIDVTFSATVTASGVIYLPLTALPNGIHTVYLEVKDNYDNFAIAIWTFTVDTTPPIITNLQPPDASITNNSTPMIGANYNDPSGIDVGSVVMEVDGINVTFSATVTAIGVGYIPGAVLSDGIHTVYLEVKDNYNNLATVTWSFTVDTLPPIITNLQPPDTSTTNDNTPTISADYSDPSGIDVNSVVLMVNGVDVTSSATVTAGKVSFIPLLALSDGIHTVYLEVKDNAGNLATATWSFTVEAPLLPITNLTTKAVNNGNYIELEWDPPSSLALDHYLIYRADSATGFDFTTPYNISTTWPNPKNSTWVDPDPSVTSIDDDFYYIIRTANFDESDVSKTSNTAGVWTKTFQPGISTFSLPLEPFVIKDVEFYCQDMNVTYIKWMNLTTHTWMRHDKGDSQNNTLIEVGEGYEIGFLGKSIPTRYTFTGLPGAMIIYDDDIQFPGFDPDSDARNLTASVEPNGNVILTWQEPASMGFGDWYEVYYSNERDGFFGTFGNEYDFACPSFGFGNNTTTISGLGANDPGARLYFMVVPFNSLGIRGASTYSIGIWTEEYLAQYDTFGIPLKLNLNQTADWYCDNIPDTVGINYYILSEQRWGWHSTRMPQGAFDTVLEMAEGYQISTSGSTKFTFIGI